MKRQIFLRLLLMLVLLVIAKFAFDRLVGYENIGRPFAEAICLVDSILGYDCIVQGNQIAYGIYRYNIVFFCTGIDQVIFFLILSLSYFGLTNKKIFRDVLLISAGLFMLNLVKMIVFHPLAMAFGYEAVRDIHNFIFNYVQGLALLAIFCFYAFFRLKKTKIPAAKRIKR